MVRHGMLVEGTSEYTSPLFIVDREGKSPRVVCDYKTLNSKTKSDNYEMPHCDELIDKLVSAKFISVFDFVKGYFQVELAASSRKYAAVTSPFGTYLWTVMPQGLQTAPA